jgi:hypothetical protein
MFFSSLLGDGVSNILCIPFRCGPQPMANFGTLSIRSAEIDGVSLKAEGAVAVDMATGGILQVATGALSAKGNAWDEVFQHS